MMSVLSSTSTTIRSVFTPLLVGLLTVVVAGCAGGASPGADGSGPIDGSVLPSPTEIGTSGTVSDDAAGVRRLLGSLGAERLIVMAGDEALRAGLGAVTESGLKPLRTRPDLAQLSNV